MNKEIMEIVEIKNEIEDLKKLNAEENEKINKKIKEVKASSKKLIEGKFEEIFETFNFSMQNNQGKSNANSTENINKIIEKKINSYVEKQENDMGDLTSLVEEIANRIIDENKKITQRLNEQEDNYTAEEYEQTFTDIKRIIKVLEKEIQSVQDETKGKINEIKEKENYNNEQIEQIEEKVNELLENKNDVVEEEINKNFIEKYKSNEKLIKKLMKFQVNTKMKTIK